MRPPRSSWTLPLLVTAIVIFIVALALVLLTGPNVPDADTWDFVIVGSGAGGAIVAEELSAGGAYTVLVLEAGPDQDANPIIADIGQSPLLLTARYLSEFFWNQVQTSTATVAPPLVTTDLFYTGGRLNGGSTSINGGQYVRGTDWMRARWVNLTHDELWNESNALAIWISLENYTGVNFDQARRGDLGRLQVLEEFITPPQTTPTSMSIKLTAALTQLTNLSALDDYNNLTAATQLGPFTSWQVTATPAGVRSSSTTAFLSAAVRARSNLQLFNSATALRLVIDASKAVTGISYLRDGVAHAATARRRVILAAGINSALILQNSGIGPGGAVYDNPSVGATMYNHQAFLAYFTKNLSDVPSANPLDLYEGGAWLPSTLNTTPETADLSPRRFGLIAENLGTLMPVLIFNMQPKAAGYVHPFATNDPLRMPNVSENVFAGADGAIDLAEMVGAAQRYLCELGQEFAGTGQGPAIDTSYVLVEPNAATCANVTLLTAWVLANTVINTHHWAGQCRMGYEGDGVSVADARGSVWGVTRLTVADASLIPTPFDGNTMAPAYLIGKTIAREILAGRVP